MKELVKIKNLDEIKENEIILDIGFNTIKKIKKRLTSQILFCGMDQPGILKMRTFQQELYRLLKTSQRIL